MDSALVKRDPEIMSGALCFTGTRVLAKTLFDYLEGTSSLEDFLEDFPAVNRERAVAVLEAARERLAEHAPTVLLVASGPEAGACACESGPWQLRTHHR